ncbi:interleukin-18-binding protein isoform X5 [Meriones unguiculatus]|uniref:interleukin-18-binding protein isoform X5 n=1 Tax=Meriones unguiculatus TaxID=10047 RepID=UPI00293EB279|nr:interleukin-18-binding protein isoform X5 [Meriones unguiculatus]
MDPPNLIISLPVATSFPSDHRIPHLRLQHLTPSECTGPSAPRGSGTTFREYSFRILSGSDFVPAKPQPLSSWHQCWGTTSWLWVSSRLAGVPDREVAISCGGIFGSQAAILSPGGRRSSSGLKSQVGSIDLAVDPHVAVAVCEEGGLAAESFASQRLKWMDVSDTA